MMSIHPFAAAIFVALILLTLVITFWAHRRSSSALGFYAAGGRITPLQNGLAIAGDYLSAASFLGTIAVFASIGEDGLAYAVGAASGWPLVMFLVAERLRNLGHYTFSDVVSLRLEKRPIRLLTAVSTLCITGAYLIAQMVAGGTLIAGLFGIPYGSAVVCFGMLMAFYVSFGGMTATTWIQIIKAVMLLGVALFMLALAVRSFGFDAGALVQAASGSTASSAPRRPLLPDWFSALSLALAFALGPAGLPHILMRFFTVRDGSSARRSLGVAAIIIALFQVLVIALGWAAMALITGDERFTTPEGGIVGGANRATLHLANHLGGDILLGVVGAVTFATILAVVAGLTLAAASAVSHDLYKHVFGRGAVSEKREVAMSKIAAVFIGVAAIYLGLLFEHENIGFLATLPLVIAASVNCPILLLAIYWRGLTTRGALAGGAVGLVLSVVPIVLSHKVWVEAFGNERALFPYEYPTAISLAAALLVTVLVSYFDRSPRAVAERAAFDAQTGQAAPS